MDAITPEYCVQLDWHRQSTVVQYADNLSASSGLQFLVVRYPTDIEYTIIPADYMYELFKAGEIVHVTS